MISGCGSKPKAQAPPPPPPPPKPVTATLSASPASIERGQSSTLTWSTENSDDVTLEGVGKVDASGSKSVSPTQSTNYRLVAKGPGGTQEADRKSTRLNSSHTVISYAVFCLKKKRNPTTHAHARELSQREW